MSTHAAVKLFIDCDAGVDDAQGLVLALRHPGVEVVGISTVHGNVESRQVVKNVARILTLLQKPTPYYEGCNEPLLGEKIDASFWHGRDGLGDVPHIRPPSASIIASPGEGHASEAIVRAARAHKGQLRLIGIGPLTNIALALKLEPSLPQLVQSLTVMGGAEAGGNVTPTAEFNFFCDPEAAHLVLKKFERVTLVSWDVVLRLGQPWPAYDAWLGDDSSPVATFLEHVGRVGVAHDKASASGGKWLICDPIAVAVALDETLITVSKDAYCCVELHGSLTRGQLIVDETGQYKKAANVRLVTDVDMGRLKAMLSDSVASASGQ